VREWAESDPKDKTAVHGATVGWDARIEGTNTLSSLAVRLYTEAGSAVRWKKVCSSFGGEYRSKWAQNEFQKRMKEEGGRVGLREEE
jgi:hypothetical protein